MVVASVVLDFCNCEDDCGDETEAVGVIAGDVVVASVVLDFCTSAGTLYQLGTFFPLYRQSLFRFTTFGLVCGPRRMRYTKSLIFLVITYGPCHECPSFGDNPFFR